MRYFYPMHRYRGESIWTWRMCRDGRHVTVRREYILGSDCWNFYNVIARETRSSTDHRVILAKLRGCGTQKN